MNLPELQERIARWENLHTEFKEWPVHPDDLAASIVAFANTDGGQLILGVTKDREIVGVTDSDQVARVVDDVAANNCEPPISVIQEVLHTGAGPVVVVNIEKGDMRPYLTNRGVPYARTTSGRRKASREKLLRMFQATEALFYDETAFLRLTLADLDLDAVDQFLDSTGQGDFKSDVPNLLASWRLMVAGHPTLAGLVLFGRNPQQHLPFAQINALRFPGSDSSEEPSDNKELKGRLLEVIDQAIRFLDLNLPTPHQIRGLEPEPKPELPKEALREAIVNAVAHRDYTVRGPIRLFIFADRVEVHAPGRPPNTVDENTMRAGIHVVRNPHIYTRLSDAGLVTRAGTGVRRMVRLLRDATGKDIGIAISDAEVVLTLPRKDTGA